MKSFSHRARRLQEALWQIAPAVEGTSHDYVAVDDFIEKDMDVKGTHNDEESPCGEAGMRQPGNGAEQRLALEECAGACNGCKVAIGYVPPGMFGVSLILQFGVGDEVVRFAHAHAAGPLSRARTRWRMAAKSPATNALVGLSADSISHASSSGVSAKGRC